MAKNKLNYGGSTAYQPFHLDYYGNAFQVPRSKVLGASIIFCLVTPFTNWLIPILPKLIKTGFTVRWD